MSTKTEIMMDLRRTIRRKAITKTIVEAISILAILAIITIGLFTC